MSDEVRESQRAWCLNEVSWTTEVWYVIKLKQCVLHLFCFLFFLISAWIDHFGICRFLLMRLKSARFSANWSEPQLCRHELAEKKKKKKSGRTRPDARAVASLAHCRIVPRRTRVQLLWRRVRAFQVLIYVSLCIVGIIWPRWLVKEALERPGLPPSSIPMNWSSLWRS